MKRKFILAMVLLCGFGLSTLKAQEWSAVQKEVWKNVNEYWALLAKGDLDGFFGYFNSDYVGWDNDNALPSTKEEAKKALTYFFAGAKIPFYEIKPLAIKVHGEFAFADYTYSLVMVYPDGKRKSEKGTWTDILMKEGNKWVMIGDHGGATETQSL